MSCNNNANDILAKIRRRNMNQNIIFKLPTEEILKKSTHITNAICVGQSEKEQRVFILKGGTISIKKEVAGAIAYGCTHTDYQLPENTEMVIMEHEKQSGETVLVENENYRKESEREAIQRELDKLMPQFFSFDEEVEACETKEKQIDNNKKTEEEIHLIAEEIRVLEREKEIKKSVSQPVKFQEAILRRDFVEGYFMGGTIISEVESEVYENLENMLKDKPQEMPMIIAIDGISDNMIRRLQFEYDADLVMVKNPDMNYYIDMFTYMLEKKGLELAEQNDVESIVCNIRNFRAENFGVEDFEKAIEKARKKADKEGRTTLDITDFNFFGNGYKDPEQLLQETVGLEKVKNKILRMKMFHWFNLMRFGLTYQHNSCNVAFAGSPGTGKTTVANLYAAMLAKIGITNGIFICASKSDYVGEFQGWTAKKMKALFERARGGVIMFDEAAAFLTKDSYSREALTELVRFMEMYPDVICIFASYEENIKQLLEKDSGLRSRIAEVITFENYSNEELYEILKKFCSEEKFELQDSREIFFHYIEQERHTHPKSFGNGRLCRNVFEKAKEILATETLNKKINPQEVDMISTETIAQAIAELRENSTNNEKEYKIGFGI